MFKNSVVVKGQVVQNCGAYRGHDSHGAFFFLYKPLRLLTTSSKISNIPGLRSLSMYEITKSRKKLILRTV